MIIGSVSSLREPLIEITVSGPTGQQADVDVVVDTAFDGWLTLPPEAIAALNLRWLRSSAMQLADGTEALFDVYDATLMWDGEARQVRVDQVDGEPLIGTALLEGFELLRLGGSVKIERLA